MKKETSHFLFVNHALSSVMLPGNKHYRASAKSDKQTKNMHADKKVSNYMYVVFTLNIDTEGTVQTK